MKCHIHNKNGDVRVEDREPVCGQDFCDSCGECLVCYAGECVESDDGEHLWVVYEDEGAAK